MPSAAPGSCVTLLSGTSPMRILDLTTSTLASTARLGLGTFASSRLGPRPQGRLILYEFEACPWCRRVREALTHLDLEVEVRPCPKGGTRFRPEAQERSGRSQFPFLVDEGAGVELLESADIVAHLYRSYGAGSPPLWLSVTPLFLPSSQLASLSRMARGLWARPSRAPDQPLELYSFESSPYCRLVREVLCELELPYRLHNVAKGSPSRPAFVERSGRMMVPWLHDPHTGVEMFESADIVRYLDQTWGA